MADALAQCDRELKASPRNPALLTLKGLALQAAGEPRASLAVLRQALAIDPSSMAALQAAAQLEFAARDTEARARLQSILKLAPAAQPARAMLATLLFEARDCAAAIPHLARLPLEPAVRWQYAVCLFEQREWTAAAAQFAALLALRDHEPTRFNLGLAQFEARHYRAAIATLEPLASVDGLRLLAAAYQAARQTPRAIEVLQKAMAKYPDDERPLADLGIHCIEHQAWPLGVEVLEAGIVRWPGSARLLTLLGVLRVRAGDIERGQAAFTAAARLHSPEAGLGRIGLASALMQMGLAGDAVRLLRPHAGAGDARTDLTLVRALLQTAEASATGDRQEARLLLDSVVRAEPANAAALGLLGKLLAQLQQWAPAEKALREAVRLDDADRGSHYQLMNLYRRTGRPLLASEAARRVRLLAAREQAEDNRQFLLLRTN